MHRARPRGSYRLVVQSHITCPSPCYADFSHTQPDLVLQQADLAECMGLAVSSVQQLRGKSMADLNLPPSPCLSLV